jgi:serine/threonine-protein kinase
MGEVYRADDLKLRQPVALKFLPQALSRDTRRLERFHHEVRVARQVSHPNVCRVYDIGEADGQQFISMEYVDGADLASVLRRMGRPSKDKAIQIARQLCAGLAAAHDKGVLHRDLKPHNVMIDERGKVRITDFGLAGFAEEFTGGEVSAGTPAYMAPEQLAGREVSVKSDLYALGLVLFELFTGQKAFEGATPQEIQRSRDETPRSSLSGIVDDVDPAVERVVLRCLETQPGARPSSALAVAAALPGGDPLAAALEAGETPDPAMVAAAGEVGGLSPAVAVPCLIGVLIGLVAAALLNDPTGLFRQVTLAQPPQALAYQASEIIQRLGHTEVAVDSAYGFGVDEDYLRYIEKSDKSRNRWEKLAANRPPAMYFWYRQSPRVMTPPQSEWNVTWLQPPKTVSGMAGVVLDPAGRLIKLDVVPPQRKDPRDPGAPQPSEWSVLFEAAELDMASFSPTAPLWNPIVACDERVAWTGSYPDQPGIELRVEAGAYRGRPNFFELIGPWSRPTRMEAAAVSAPSYAGDVGLLLIVIGAMVGGVFIAWRNLKLKRGDRRGAFRLSVAVLIMGILEWLLGSTYVSDPWTQFFRFWDGTGTLLLFAGMLWILYIALEPYVRRRWPQVLISWMRMLDGRFRDPLVGRDVLIGALVGVLFLLSWQARHLALGLFGPLPPPHQKVELETLTMARYLASWMLGPMFVWVAFLSLFVLFALRVVLRKPSLAVLGYLLIFTAVWSLQMPAGLGGAAGCCYVLMTALQQSIVLIVLMRFGLLPLVVGHFVFQLRRLPLTLDFTAWYSTGSLVVMLVALAVAGYGFWVSLAGRPLLKDELLET